MSTEDTVMVTAEIIFTTDTGKAPDKVAMERLIADQLGGNLDDDTGLRAPVVKVLSHSNDHIESSIVGEPVDDCEICGSQVHTEDDHGGPVYIVDTSCNMADLIDKKMSVLHDLRSPSTLQCPDPFFDRAARELDEMHKNRLGGSESEPDLDYITYLEDRIDSLIYNVGWVPVNNPDGGAWLVYKSVED